MKADCVIQGSVRQGQDSSYAQQEVCPLVAARRIYNDHAFSARHDI